MIGFDHVVLNVSPDAVLWPEQRPQVYLSMLREQICRVSKSVVHRCLVAD
jgi:hypothetical protein